MEGHSKQRNLDNFSGRPWNFANWPAEFGKIFCRKQWALVITMATCTLYVWYLLNYSSGNFGFLSELLVKKSIKTGNIKWHVNNRNGTILGTLHTVHIVHKSPAAVHNSIGMIKSIQISVVQNTCTQHTRYKYDTKNISIMCSSYVNTSNESRLSTNYATESNQPVTFAGTL